MTTSPSQTESSIASFYSFTAAVLAEYLGRVIQSRRTDPSRLPIGVYASAKDFFAHIISAHADGSVLTQRKMECYKLAIDVLVTYASPVPNTFLAADAHFQRYANLLNQLDVEKNLHSDDLVTAGELQEFFLRIAMIGDAESYRSVVCFEG